MTPRSGRAPRGERVVGVALRLTGVTAAMTVEGAMDRCAFDAFVAPVVVWDTLRVHTSDDAQRLIEARGCQLLWRPPSSPDVTPIEQAFSKRTTALRRTGARTREALDDAITAGLATITAADTPGWFAHGGYPIPAQLRGEPL